MPGGSWYTISFWPDHVVYARDLPGVEDGNADVKLFQSGENDWVYQLPPGTYEDRRSSSRRTCATRRCSACATTRFNNQDPALKDVRVRKALSMVIDRDILAQKVTADGQLPAYGLIVKGMEGADDDRLRLGRRPMAKKVAEAKKLLARRRRQARHEDTSSRTTPANITRRWRFSRHRSGRRSWASNMELEAMEFKVLVKKRHDGDFRSRATAASPTTTTPPTSSRWCAATRTRTTTSTATARPKN